MIRFEYGKSYPLRRPNKRGTLKTEYNVTCTGIRRELGKIRLEYKDKVIVAYLDETNDYEVAILPPNMSMVYQNIGADEFVKN